MRVAFPVTEISRRFILSIDELSELYFESHGFKGIVQPKLEIVIVYSHLLVFQSHAVIFL